MLWSNWELEALCRFVLWPDRLFRPEGMAKVDGATPSFRVYRKGSSVVPAVYRNSAGAFSAEAIQKLYDSGIACIIAPFQNYSNAALAVSRELEATLGCPVRTHLFVTRGSGQALEPHSDPQDVLAMQLLGEKSWGIRPRTINEPGAGADVASPSAAPQIEETTLRSGGWLYLPKGYWHAVENKAQELSVHLSFTIQSVTWARIFRESLEKAAEALPSMDAPLPLNTPLTQTPQEIEGRLRMILPFVNLAAQSDAYYSKYRCLGQLVPPAEIPSRAALNAADTANSFVWRKGFAQLSADFSELHLPYRRDPLILLPHLGPVVKWMEQTVSFRASDVPLPDRGIALLFCKFLANNGFLKLLE